MDTNIIYHYLNNTIPGIYQLFLHLKPISPEQEVLQTVVLYDWRTGLSQFFYKIMV